MKTRILLAVVVLALVAGVVYRTQFGNGEGQGGGGGGAIEVKTVAVEVRDFPRVVELPGTVESARQVDLVAQVGGT
ncbi:MAG: efflux RND transporter periplasmic adaptor subunit, partial [Pseudomonadota bacterium]